MEATGCWLTCRRPARAVTSGKHFREGGRSRSDGHFSTTGLLSKRATAVNSAYDNLGMGRGSHALPYDNKLSYSRRIRARNGLSQL